MSLMPTNRRCRECGSRLTQFELVYCRAHQPSHEATPGAVPAEPSPQKSLDLVALAARARSAAQRVRENTEELRRICDALEELLDS